MRKSFLTLLMTLLVAVAYALPIESIGAAFEVHNGNDTLLFFKGSIDVRSKDEIGEVTWYSIETGEALDSQPTKQQYNLNPGGYYVVKDGVEYAPFYVFQYTAPGALTLSLTPECGETPMTVQGDLKPYTYTRRNGTTATYARACAVYYNELSWTGEVWEDSARVYEPKTGLQSYIALPALYGATPVRLCVESELRTQLGFADSLCYETELKPEEVKAVSQQLVAFATPHDAKNELMKLTETKYTKQIEGNQYSGPLEFTFCSNPTPAVQFFTWTIKKAEEVIVTRRDKDIRYTFSFSEPSPAGTRYTVECQVNNATCDSEKEKIEVNISKSDLRVPNFFSPNGDGANDEFRVAYQSLKSFHCEIYNRWGKKVFQWDDPSKGWDGTIYGKPAAEGAYFYIIHAVGTDDLVYKRSGDINLLRGKR